ncbi:F-box/LRR-repeat protein 20-like isoform X15 [Periplaneta americana]|uniref:F-box/LRR-repeat protein 20-like isoform X15 n=1 Tax=Periplaneta americana TaxID=6978 RepID=UPI0037E838EA
MIELLPNEVMLKIFSYLDTKDLVLSVQHVNYRWQELSRDRTLWKDRVFEPRMRDKDNVRALKNMPCLRACVSTRGNNAKPIINSLCKYCDDIEYLSLDGYDRLEYPLLVKLTNFFPNIQKLTIPFLKEDNPLQFSQLIGSLQNLTHLGFSDRYVRVQDDVLKPIADGCPSLQHMNLGENMFKGEDVMYFLMKKLTQLLSFRAKCDMTLAIYFCILQCKKLEHLDCTGSGCSSDMTSNDIKLLRNLKNLKTLMLWHLSETQFRAIPSLLEAGSLSNITKLGIVQHDLSCVVRNCPQLLELSVNGTKDVLEEGFKYIGNCKNLRYLSFSFCSNVTAKCLDYVAAGCPNLRHLDLSWTFHLDDSLFLSVLKCKNVRVLDISHSGLKGNWRSSKCYLIPLRLVHLNELIVFGCVVDGKVLDTLLLAMPHLKLPGYVVSDDDYDDGDGVDDDDD